MIIESRLEVIAIYTYGGKPSADYRERSVMYFNAGNGSSYLNGVPVSAGSKKVGLQDLLQGAMNP